MNRLLLSLLFVFAIAPCAAQAQELAKIRHDYFRNPTGKYSPDDPWTRSRIWLRHTGHYGKFYNCDCEEQKRNSPYICWKNADCPFVGEGLLWQLHRDRQRIRQRIADGSCNCGCKGNHAAKPCQCDRCSSNGKKSYAKNETRSNQAKERLAESSDSSSRKSSRK